MSPLKEQDLSSFAPNQDDASTSDHDLEMALRKETNHSPSSTPDLDDDAAFCQEVERVLLEYLGDTDLSSSSVPNKDDASTSGQDREIATPRKTKLSSSSVRKQAGTSISRQDQEIATSRKRASTSGLPEGYEWREDVIAREELMLTAGGDPVILNKTLVFEMPKDADWDPSDKETQMLRKREYLCQRYSSINLDFEGDEPYRRGAKPGRIFVPKDDYYALFEVWNSPNAHIQYHTCMILLERGLGLVQEEFDKLQSALKEDVLKATAEAEAAVAAATDRGNRKISVVGDQDEKADKKRAKSPQSSPSPPPKRVSRRGILKRRLASKANDVQEPTHIHSRRPSFVRGRGKGKY